MVSRTLSERFAESGGSPIKYRGLMVHGIYRVEVHPGEKAVIKFIRAATEVRQGLRIKIKPGSLRIDARPLKDIVLWADNSPPTVEMTLHPPNKGGMLHIWNAWEARGVMHAWLGNAGMIVQDRKSIIRIRCSDGIGAPDFEDLVVDITIVRPQIEKAKETVRKRRAGGDQ